MAQVQQLAVIQPNGLSTEIVIPECLATLNQVGLTPDAVSVAAKEYSAIRVRNINDACELHGKTPMLCTLSSKCYNGTKLFIVVGLMDVLACINISQDLDERQLTRCAELIMNEYNDLDIPALKLFFNNIILGKYGKIYGHIGINDILGWLNKFYVEYWEVVGEQLRSEHDKTKSDTEVGLLTDEQVKDWYESLRHPKPQEPKTETDVRYEISKRIADEEQHLFSIMSFEKASAIIKEKIQSELFSQGIFV